MNLPSILPTALALSLLATACAAPASSPAGPGSPSATSPPPSASPRSSPPPSASSDASPSPTASAPVGLTSDPLHLVELRDVRNGATFTLGQLAAEKPLLLEMMAIWCTNCRAQMHRVVEAHEMADFHSVGLDVDATEIGADLRDYAEREGFDWPFAMADRDVAVLLRERFGLQVLNPPNTPMVLLFPDGSVRLLDFGGYSVDELVAQIEAG